MISIEVLLQVGLVVAPGEVGVALREAAFGERVHDVRAGEGFGEEDRVGCSLLDFRDAPLPEGQGLGVRVVDAEDANAAVDPELEDAIERVPKAAPVGRLEVERIDVLVFFRRVFGVLDGAVRAVDEPVGMFLDPGVIGRALEGDIQRDLDAVWSRGGCDQRVEIGERAEFGQDACVATFLRLPIAQGLPTSPGSAVTELFLPLRKAVPMGWIGGI